MKSNLIAIKLLKFYHALKGWEKFKIKKFFFFLSYVGFAFNHFSKAVFKDIYLINFQKPKIASLKEACDELRHIFIE